MERSRGSFVSRQRLSEEWPMYSRYRWRPNFSGFSHLLDAGIIQMDPKVLEELVVEAMQDTLSDPSRYLDPPKQGPE